MNCPQKNHNCTQTYFIRLNEKNYICSGINSKPTKYEKDNIWLCLSGAYGSNTIEMTRDEALIISCALATVTAAIQEREVSKIMARKKAKKKKVSKKKTKKSKKRR